MEITILERLQQALMLICTVSAPVLLTALATGLIVSFFQAVTQIQEQTLSFVPKILLVFITLSLTMTWMIRSMVSFTQQILETMPYILD